MRQILFRVLAGAALVLTLAGFAATPAQAAAPGGVTVSSPCYEPAYGATWVYWTVTNHTAADIEATLTNDTGQPPMFTIPAGGSVVRETLGGSTVEVMVGGVVVASAPVPPSDALTACGTEPASFNLIVDCRPSPYQVTLRIKNATDQARQYKLSKQRGEELTGTALPGNTYITEDWVKATDRWKLDIAGYSYVRVVNEPPLCNAPSPTPTTTRTPSPPPATTNAPSPAPTVTAPPPTQTVAPTGGDTIGPDPTLAPASSSSGLDSGNGVLAVGLACLLVGSVLGATFRLRRRCTE
ncbi:hypothetical protein [Micromonospora fulviviridis]|uniref:LPXTG cell wall anchor domain-containing protein n=1 Tax=Micromonospora fulviviridis TaxID=47860 RepID=A0ABV2VW09_9ACTN